MNWETLLVLAGLGLAALVVLRVVGNAVEWADRAADAEENERIRALAEKGRPSDNTQSPSTHRPPPSATAEPPMAARYGDSPASDTDGVPTTSRA